MDTTDRRAGSSLLVILAWTLIAIGLGVALLGYLLARDWLLVNQEALHFGLGVRSQLKVLFTNLLGLTPDHDVVEILLAAAAASAIAFGAGVLVGRGSAHRGRLP